MSDATNMSEEEKEAKIREYIVALDELDRAMAPYREHKKDLKQSYLENEWLTKEEMSLALRAYRLLNNKVDIEQLLDYVDVLRGSTGD